MTYTLSIDAATLNAHLNDPNWVIVDCRFNLLNPEAGPLAYQEGHIPGARYAHLNDQLAGPITPATGRHPLPDPEQLAHTFGAWGIGPTTQVVAYDSTGGMLAAARLWWLLRWLGHTAVAILDGGLTAWQQADLPLTDGLPMVTPTRFAAKRDDNCWLTTAQVLALPQECVVLDARAAPRYRGEIEPIDPVAGHIAGALNLPTDVHLTPEGFFLPAEVLREQFAAVLGDRPENTVVHSCGSGITACHNYFMMELAGLSGSRVYAGSWSEWIRDPSRPIATGE